MSEGLYWKKRRRESGMGDKQDKGKPGCLFYLFTGRTGNCFMLPVWQAIAQIWRNINGA